MMRALLIAGLATLVAAALVPATAQAGRCRPFGATFSPSRGDPQSMRVRFTVSRFGRNRPIYLHYLAPDRRRRATVYLGRTAGLCGYLRTGWRPLFPFRTRPGTWRLQFTTQRAYRVRPTRPFVTLAVTIVDS